MKRTKKDFHLTVYTPLCPNGAGHRYFSEKALDLLTGIASVVGFITAMGVLLILA